MDDGTRSKMVKDIIFMRGNSMYPKSQIVGALAWMYYPETVYTAEKILDMARSGKDDEQVKQQITKELALSYNPGLVELVDRVLVEYGLAAPKNDEQEQSMTHDWIESGEGTWVAKTLEACMMQQQGVLGEFTEDQKKGGYGFACRLMVGKIENREFVENDEGGVFNLMFNEKGVVPKPADVELRNTVCIDVDTLFDIIMPDISRVHIQSDGGVLTGMDAVLSIFESGGYDKLIPQLRPRMTIAEAIANGKILFGGDKPDIDSEMWSKMSEAVLVKLAYPLAVKSLVQAAQK